MRILLCSVAALFVAAMREWKRSFESQSRSFAGLVAYRLTTLAAAISPKKTIEGGTSSISIDSRAYAQ